MKPLHWIRNPKRMSDGRLVAELDHVLLQLRNRTHLEDPEAKDWLEGLCLALLHEIEQRIAQGVLF